MTAERGEQTSRPNGTEQSSQGAGERVLRSNVETFVPPADQEPEVAPGSSVGEYEAPPDPMLCRVCGAPAEPGGYVVGLCPEHRTALSRRPLPNWVRISALGVVALFIFSLTELPSSLHAGTSFVRGQRAEAAGRHAEAAAAYDAVVQRYPSSTKALIRSFIEHARAGEREAALKSLDQLEKVGKGKKLTKEEERDMEAAVRTITGRR